MTQTSIVHRRFSFALLGAATLMATWPPPDALAVHGELTQGDIRVSVEIPGRGLVVTCGGVELIKRSSMVVTTPPWGPHYYVSHMGAAQATIERSTTADGERLTVVHHGERDTFVGTEMLTLAPDGVLEQTFEARFNEPEGEALIQWCIAALNPTAIAGRTYVADLSGGGQRRGVVPVRATTSDLAECTLAKGFAALVFASRLGPVRIDVDARRPLICYDYRSSRWADPSDPFFWFGDLDSRIRPNQPLHYRIVYHLPAPSRQGGKPRTLAFTAKTTPTPTAQTTQLGDVPRITPRPKEAEFTPEHAVLDGTQMLAERISPALRTLLGKDAAAAERALEMLVQDWRRIGGAPGRPAATPSTQTNAHRSWQLTATTADNALPPEGYLLDVSTSGITIAAGDARGVENACQTLRQISAPAADGTIHVRGCRIKDWPSLAFRGVHFFTGGRGNRLHLDLLHKIIAATKLNHIVLEAEYINWDTHPEIHHPEFGMAKDEVREFLAACRAHQIEVTPLVQSLGHCQWMFEHGQNLDLAEDPAARWAYCVTNPKTYDFIFEIYAEALALFQPKYFHIGHDEFADRGRVPYRETSKPYSVEQLLMMDTLRLHAWFTERGIPLMMWGDMLLAKSEAPDACNAVSEASAEALRAELPKDVIITDWHYVTVDPDKYISLATIHRGGHRTIAAAWFRPSNIVNLAQAAHEQGSWGFLQTTWAGYSLDEASFARELKQYAAWVLAAEAAWNADHPPDAEAYPAGGRFLDLMGMSALQPQNRSGQLVDLSAAYNHPLTARDAAGWFGMGPDHDLSAVPGGAVQFTGLAFQLAAPTQPSAVALHGLLAADLRLPQAVDIAVDLPATERLAILHTTNFAAAAGARIGAYTVSYASGRTASVDVIYGENVFAYNDVSPAAAAPAVWMGKTRAGEAVALRALLWDLPKSDEPIRGITLRGGDAAGSLMVLGITALAGEPTGKAASQEPTATP